MLRLADMLATLETFNRKHALADEKASNHNEDAKRTLPLAHDQKACLPVFA
jgi:hypothetical protein